MRRPQPPRVEQALVRVAPVAAHRVRRPPLRLQHDIQVVLQPEWRPGVAARANALLESMVPVQPMPESLAGRDYTRTPIYVQEIAHRRATRQRNIPGI